MHASWFRLQPIIKYRQVYFSHLLITSRLYCWEVEVFKLWYILQFLTICSDCHNWTLEQFLLNNNLVFALTGWISYGFFQKCIACILRILSLKEMAFLQQMWVRVNILHVWTKFFILMTWCKFLDLYILMYLRVDLIDVNIMALLNRLLYF